MNAQRETISETIAVGSVERNSGHVTAVPPPSGKTPPGKVGYIIKGFPRMSEVFISNEIALLEQMGLKIRIYSIKKSSEAEHHKSVETIKAQRTYLPPVDSLSRNDFWPWLRSTLPKYAVAHKQLFRRRPWRYVKTLFLALSMCVKYRPGVFFPVKKVFIKEFIQAGYIAWEAQRSGDVAHWHAHFCHGATTVAWFVSSLTGTPFSFTAHAKDIYLPKLNPGDLLNRKVEKAAFVLTCTGANKTFLQQLCPKMHTPVHVVYHGLDTEHFRPGSAAAAQQPPLVLSVGRFVEKKGFEYLVRACRVLKDRGILFSTVILGEEGEQSAFIRALIAELGLQNEVKILPAMTQDNLQSMYRKASVFALPCQVVANGDRDGIPNVLAEAMANELPVVSTRISGIPELVSSGIDGLLIPEKDVAALSEALERLLSDKSLRLRLGTAAREKIQRIFDSRRNTLRIYALFAEKVQAAA